MHIGQTKGPDTERPVLDINGIKDGASDPFGLIQGTYVHGLFNEDKFRQAWLKSLKAEPSNLAYEEEVDRILDDLGTHFSNNLDIETMLTAAK